MILIASKILQCTKSSQAFASLFVRFLLYDSCCGHGGFFGGPSAKKKSTSPLWEKQKNVIQFLVYSSITILSSSMHH